MLLNRRAGLLVDRDKRGTTLAVRKIVAIPALDADSPIDTVHDFLHAGTIELGVIEQRLLLAADALIIEIEEQLSGTVANATHGKSLPNGHRDHHGRTNRDLEHLLLFDGLPDVKNLAATERADVVHTSQQYCVFEHMVDVLEKT